MPDESKITRAFRLLTERNHQAVAAEIILMSRSELLIFGAKVGEDLAGTAMAGEIGAVVAILDSREASRLKLGKRRTPQERARELGGMRV